MTGKIVNNLIEIRQGDSFDLVFRIANSQGKTLGLENSSFKMQVRDNDNNVIFTKEAEVCESDSLVRFALTPEDTDILIGDYQTDIQWTDENGRVNTIWPQDVNKIGTFRITKQVTQ